VPTDGAWLQAQLVERGLAVVAPAGDVPDEVLRDLLRLEGEARAAGRGRWTGGGPGPYPAEAVAASRGSFVLVQGVVRAVSRRQELTYLDFGLDWRRDFTVRVETARLAKFARAGLDVGDLTGKRILVRG
jgi:micrococcal nuclease